jgi:signal transduction histidine kinase
VAPLQADADRITQVVLNLLSNAAKYAPREGGQVTLSLQDTADGVAVQVQDNGPGIPLEQQERVFEKFRQVSGDEHYRPGGTGLGLPISRQIVEHFGGRIWLRSVPGQGACFGFTLPRRTAATVH